MIPVTIEFYKVIEHGENEPGRWEHEFSIDKFLYSVPQYKDKIKITGKTYVVHDVDYLLSGISASINLISIKAIRRVPYTEEK